MTTRDTEGGSQTEPDKPRKLPRRDLLILPLIAFGVILALIAIPETIFQFLFYSNERDVCLLPDPVLGHRAAANCVSEYKAAETPWIENRYNDCGYRTKESCGPKPPGTIRVAVLGSSISAGWMVPYEASFTELAAEALTKDCNRPVEFQDLGGIGYKLKRVYARAQESLSIKPDLVVMAISPQDVVAKDEELPEAPKNDILGTIAFDINAVIHDSATWSAVLYFRGQIISQFMQFYLRDPYRSDYLRQPFSPAWQARVDSTETMLGRIAETFHAANVPFVLVYVPLRPQALLLHDDQGFPGILPTRLDHELGNTSEKFGIEYVDLMNDLNKYQDVRPFFFIVSDHLTKEGHALMASALVSDLLTKEKAIFSGCHAPTTTAFQQVR